ncbi:MAG: SH3 domain-containing protein [Clostridia bacterium]|nr:SH3 domain-containing protein [Clostridia bacterium]
MKIRKNSLISKIVIVLILLLVVLNVFRYAAYFKRENNENMGISIQNAVNIELAHDVYIDENNIIYLSEDDVREYLDKELYYEKNENNMRRYISIAQNKILEITEGQNHMFVNGVREKIKGSVMDKEGVYYFPISELENVYNIEVSYLESVNRLDIEKMSEAKVVAIVNKTVKLKYKMTNISKTIEELNQGDNVTIVQDMNNGWLRVKTSDYAIGYVKKSKLVNIKNERYDLAKNDYIDFKIENANIVEINDDIYKDFEDRISKYDSRQLMEKEILDKAIKEISRNSQNVGVKINITSVNNVDNYYKFLKELRAHVNNVGVCLIVVGQPNLDSNSLRNIVDVVI